MYRPMSEYLKLVAYALLISFCFGGGWTVRGWSEAKDREKENKRIDLAISEARSKESIRAESLEIQLAEIKKTERVIKREVIKIIEKPFYRDICLDDDGLRILREARTNAGNSTVPVGEVSESQP